MRLYCLCVVVSRGLCCAGLKLLFPPHYTPYLFLIAGLRIVQPCLSFRPEQPFLASSRKRTPILDFFPAYPGGPRGPVLELRAHHVD